MNTQTTIDNKFSTLLDFLSSAQKTCMHMHNAWCEIETGNESILENDYISSLNKPELAGKIKAIEELINDIYTYASEAAHKLEAIVQDTSASIGYEFKELDGKIQKINS